MKNWGKTVKKWSKNASILDPIYRGEIDFPNLAACFLLSVGKVASMNWFPWL